MNIQSFCIKKSLLSFISLALLGLFISSPSIANQYDWELVERFKKHLDSAQKGKVNSMYAVGKLYERGRGTKIDMPLAVQWYQKAANAGDASSKSRLGILYFEGRGVKQNYAKALKLLNAAANKNIASAQHQLANMYELGTGVSQNLQKSLLWYRSAQKNGYYLSEGKLARLQKLLNSGKGIVKNTKIKTVNSKKKSSKTLDTILRGKWFKRKKAAAYLPSNITNCVNSSNNSVQCISTSQERSTGTEIITYYTESNIKTNKNSSFNITYSNSVLDVAPIAAEDGDGNVIEHSPSRIKKGKQGKQRKLSCRIKDKKTISCSKGSSTFDLLSL